MANTTISDNETAWVQTTLSELLSSPHISIRGPPGLRMGPGPVDLFSTRFNNAFMPDVRGVVAGEEVDREGLKERLLGLQRHYSGPDAITFLDSRGGMVNGEEEEEEAGGVVEQDGGGGAGEVCVLLKGVSKETGQYEVSVEAVVVSIEGRKKISVLKLGGRQELFVRSTV